MGDLDNLIGSKISLVSQQDIRYEGILISINAAESSIVLRDVDCLGTEDRVTDPARIVKATSTKIKFVSFPGADIKDLFVHEETPAPEPAPAPAPAPTPATVFAAPAAAARKANASSNANASAAKPRAAQPQPAKPKASGSEPLGAAEIKKQGDFNFDAGLGKFDKADEYVKVKEEGGSTVDTSKYVKDDFFDSLSCDVLDRQAGRTVRVSGQQQRDLNTDTFGESAAQNTKYGYRSRNGGGGGSGGGSGGGGRGRGGGRGDGRGRGRGRGRVEN